MIRNPGYRVWLPFQGAHHPHPRLEEVVGAKGLVCCGLQKRYMYRGTLVLPGQCKACDQHDRRADVGITGGSRGHELRLNQAFFFLSGEN